MDAAGRGWRVFLCDRADLGAGTSSASTKLIHGGLRYLELYEFRLVREALKEREVLWSIAPHIIWPLRFVLPHHRRLRPAWMLRLGLLLYDHLGGRKRLSPTRTLDLRHDPAGDALKPVYRDGDILLVSPAATIRRGDRVVVRTRQSEVMIGALKRRTAKTLELECIKGEQQDRALVIADVEWVARIVWVRQ